MSTRSLFLVDFERTYASTLNTGTIKIPDGGNGNVYSLLNTSVFGTNGLSEFPDPPVPFECVRYCIQSSTAIPEAFRLFLYSFCSVPAAGRYVRS